MAIWMTTAAMKTMRKAKRQVRALEEEVRGRDAIRDQRERLTPQVFNIYRFA